MPDHQAHRAGGSQERKLLVYQKAMAQLFRIGVPAISKHLTHIYEEGELPKEQLCVKNAHTAEDGKTYSPKDCTKEIKFVQSEYL